MLVFILQKYLTSNLNVLKSFKKYPNFNLGFSDHTINNISAIVAVGLGCKYFEKHFTLNKKSKGPDHFLRIMKINLKNM